MPKGFEQNQDFMVSQAFKNTLKAQLKRDNHDGLYNSDGACACSLDDLFPCDHPSTDCEGGNYLKNVTCPNCDESAPCGFHIGQPGGLGL